MATNEDLRPSNRPALAGLGRLRALLAGALLAFAVLGGLAAFRSNEHPGPATPQFLARALGTPQPDAPTTRSPAREIEVDLADGLAVDRAGASLRLEAEGISGPWTRFADGIKRPAPFGEEAVIAKGPFAEQLLVVRHRQGRTTWRWRLHTTLDLELRNGELLFARDGTDVGYRIFPVRVFDDAGEDVTPAGAAWSLDRSGRVPVLELALDDSALPLPYVIDPPIAFVRELGSVSSKAGATTTLTFNTTAGSTAGDSVFLAVATDNIAGGACLTATYGGTALTQDSAVINDPGAGNGARATIFSGHNVGAKASGTNVTVSFFQSNCSTTASITAKAATLFEFSGLRKSGALDQTNTGSADTGSAAAVTSSTLTTTWPDSLLVGAVAIEGPIGDTFTAGASFTARTAAGTTGNPAKGNMTIRPQTRITTGTGGFTAPATIASRDWANAFATYKNGLAANGSGTMTVLPTSTLAGTTNNTLTFSYTAATYGMEDGTLALTFPAGWTAPNTTAGTPGYTTASGGAGTNSISWNGGTRVLTISGVTLTSAQVLTIAYGTGAGGAATAPAASQSGVGTFSTTQFSGDAGSGAATAIGTSPTVTVNNSPDGSGTIASSSSNVPGSSAGNTLTFTYTAATGGLNNGAVRVTVPAGWSAPSTTASAAGYTTASTGTVGVAGQVITVTGVTLSAGATMTIAYGNTGSGGPGATATATTGAQTWQTAERSTAGGAITNLAASPSVTVNAARGSGTLSSSVTSAAASATGNTITFTYTAATGGMSSGAVRVTVPAGWSAPSTTASAAGYTTASTGTVGVAGQVITVTGVTLSAAATMTITYGSTGSGGPGATATATTGAQTWQAAQDSVGSTAPANLAASPSITVFAADGSGSLTAGTSDAAAASGGNTITFTYTAAAGGISSGAVRVTVPAGWSAPSTTGSAAGYTTASTGTVGVAGQVITVTGVTLSAGATMTVAYGSTGSGGPGATATATTGAQTWQAAARSLSGSAITNLAASPSLTVNAPDGSGTLTVSPTSIVAGTSTTLTFTSTAATGGMTNGAVTILMPVGWTAPNTTAGTAGYTTASTGTVSWNGGTRILTVSGVTRAAGTTLTVVYGAGGGGAVTVPAGSGTVTWQAQQRSVATSTPTSLAASPTTVYNAPPTATVSLSPAAPTTAQTVTATATKGDGEGDPVTLTYVWKVNGVTVKTTGGSAGLTDTLDLSLGGNGDKGQAVSVEVTPNDGNQNGALVSDSETVANSAPTISSVAIDQAAPKTNDTLTVSVTSADPDGDARTYAYQWKKGGVNIGGATAATLDLSQAGNGDKADQITVQVTANDGTASSTPSTSAAVTIANSAPTISSVAIDQAAPKTNDTLSLTVVTADADGDARTVAYQWKRNGVDRFGETAATFDLAQVGNGDRGDAISVQVTANDGTAGSAPSTSGAVTVANSAPVLTAVAIDQAAPTTNDTLSATITAGDPDGDAVTPTRQWRKNGTDLGGATGATLDLAVAGNGDKGDLIALRVSVSDGFASDGPLTSSAVAVANSAPTITSVSIDQASPKTNDTVTVSVTSSDPDADPVAYAYQWRRNGTDLPGETASALDLSLAGNGSKGDAITVRVTGDDGTAPSAPVTSAARTVANTAPTATVSLAPAAPTTGAVVTATATKADADGDAVTLTYVWKIGGATRKTTAGSASLTDTFDLSGAGDGDEGEVVSVELTPNDGTTDGAAASDSETVANSLPAAAVALAPSAPTTNQTLTATATKSDPDSGDAVTLTYIWKVDGVTRKTTAGSAALTDTFALSGPGDGDEGQVVSVEVTPNDGSADGSTATDSVTVANSVPTMTAVTVDQGSPKTNDTLSVSVSSADADGDARTYSYQWRLGGVDIAGATGATLDLAQPGHGDEGDQITVSVVANDGDGDSTPLASGAVTIQNSAPAAGVSLSPDPAGTNDTLTATATKSDADGDAVALTYVWKVNGATVKTTAGSSGLADTLDLGLAGNGDPGDTVSVEVTPNDGDADGTPASDSVGIGNALPTATVALTPAAPTTGQTLTATATKADTDGGPLTLTFVWKVDGATVKTTSGSTSLTDTLKLALAGNGDKGETVSVEVTANDGLSDGNTATDSVLVANTAPTATVALAPAAPKTDELLTATATKADADGDGVTLTYVWKVDGATVKTTSGSASLTDTLDLAQAGNGDKGQTVSVEVTPNDGAAGAAATDSAVVANSTPVLSGVSIDQAAPRTNDTLTLTATATDADGDTLTPARQWRRNGSPIAGETGAALDLSLAGNGDKGDQLSVQLSVGDGTASSATLTSGAVTVLNSAPTVVSATIDQSAPKTNDAVAVAVVTADADGDARTSSFQWTKNGADRFGETASGYDLATILNGDKGDAIAVRVVASDGTESSAPVTSAAVTVANSAPVLDSVSIDQASPRTNDTLTLSATSHDDDGDAVSYAYQWRKNGLDLVSETSTSLDLGVAGNGDEGDAIAVRVTGSDGAGSSAPLLSNAVTVANTAPTATVSLAPASPTTNQTLTATATDADADGDAVTFTYLWKVDGSTVRTTAGSPGATDTLDLSQAGYGDKGQVVTVEVTPHDGDAAGSTVSDTTAVANSAPTISSVAIDQGSPATDEVLTVSIASADADGDARSYGYQWRRNGVDLAGETGATLDLAQAGHGDEGDAISVRITANDGSAASPASTSPAVTVGNSAPAIGSVTIDQAAPKTNDTLTVSVASSDSDGDGVGYTYQWRVDGIDVAGATGAALDLAQAGNGDKGDDVSVRVTATDGDDVSVPATSAPVTVQNTAPVVTVAAIDQASARTNDTLTATAATTDADGDAVTVTRQWTKNGLDRAGETAASFDLSQAGNGDKGDAIRVRVDATDGDDAAPAVTSAPLTISNTAPTATVALTPAGPATDAVVTATATTADADGDSVTLTYAWKVEGATVKTTSGSSSLTDTLDLALPGNGNGGDTVTVDATPDDGAAAGSTQSDALVVGFRPDHLTLTSATTDLASGSQRTLAVEVRDPDGALVAGDNSTQVTFAKSAGAGTVTGLGSATASGGTATLDVSAVLAGPITITATAAGLAADSSGFTVVHGAPAQIALAESGSTVSGDAHTLTATVRDAAGNPAVSDNSTVVSFLQSGGAGSVSGLGSATAASGVATHVVANGTTGQVQLEAQATGLSAGTASYTVAPGAASTATSTIAASPTSIVANGASTSTITVRLKDTIGNDLAGSGGTVALSLAGAGSLSGVTDNGDGTYTATLTSPTTTGAATVTGTLNAVALAATAGVTYTPGPATQISLVESGSATAGATHTLTATIQDANGNTVTSDSSTVVAFAKISGSGTVSGLGTATAAAGVASKTVTNRLAGAIALDAQAAGLAAGSAGYTIVAGPVSPAATDSTVSATPTAVVNDGADSATITVTLRDAGGNPIAGKAVTLDQGSGSSSISGGGSTNASGAVTFTVTSLVEEQVTYTATDTTDAIPLLDTAEVDFVFDDVIAPTNALTLDSAAGAYLSGTTLYYRPAAAGSFTLSSAVADAGAGPSSAAYPLVARSGWTHAAETVGTPAGGPFVSSTFAWTAAAAGDFSVTATAADAWTPPNTSDTTIDVTEDSTAPATGILCDGAGCPAGWLASSPVSVTLSASDGGAGLDQIRYTTDGSDPTILTGTVYAGAFAVAAEGVTTVKYRAFDRIGNDSGVQSQAIRIDTDAPETSIDASPAAATQDTTPTFAYSSDEAGATFEHRLDGGPWIAGPGPVTLGPLLQGTYTFEVQATDAAGNVDATPAAFVFTVDTTPADTTITSAPAASTNATGAAFAFTASDGGPSFECSLDGAAFAACTSPEPYSGLAESAHAFAVRAKDAAGNLDPTPAVHAWTVDTTAPDTSFLSTPATPSSNATPSFGLGSTEAPATFECNLDSAGWGSCATPFTTPALADGSHALQLRSSDAAGNTDATPTSHTWVVDASAPTGVVTSPADGAAVSGTVALASDSADAVSGVATVQFQRAPAGTGTWTNQAASWDTLLAADGDYDLRVVTSDAAGNQFASATVQVTVDNTEPGLVVVAPTTVNIASADPETISAAASDDGTGVANVRFDQCVEDSIACDSDSWLLLGVDTDDSDDYSASWPIPSDGPRLLRVRATDGAGKQTTKLQLVAVDRTPPTGSLTSPATGASLRGDVALAATASDTAPGTVNTVSFQHSPAGLGSWSTGSTDSSAPYTATLDTTTLADGLHDLRVFTTDAAGNAAAAPATVQVRVDNTLPSGDVTFPADGAEVRGTVALTSDSADAGGSGVATVQFQRSPAGAGTWTSQAAAFDTTAVGDGLYDLRVVTTDEAGNARTSAPVTIRVDNTKPTGAVTTPAAGANVRQTVALASDSADAGGSGVATVQFQRSPAGAGSWTNQAASWNTTLQADGLYDVRVLTADDAGNAFTSPSIAIRVDNTAPTGAVTAPANGAEVGVAPVSLTSDSADAGGSGVASVVFERSPASAGTWSAVPASWNTASGPNAVGDGSYDVRVTTTDVAGNAFTSASVAVLVDHTAPTTSVNLVPGTPSNAPVTVGFTAGDGSGSGVSTTAYRVDGGSWQFGGSVIVPAPGDHSNDGAHVVEFFSTDEVGNVESVKSTTVVIDTTAPSGSPGDPGDYLRGLANLTYATAATDVVSVQFQFSPAGAGAWSSIGAADLAPPYEATWNTALAADGAYDLRAVVTDGTGNVANELLPGLPKTVDNTSPSGSVTSPLAAAYVSGSVDVTASATDAGSGIAAVRFEVKPTGAGSFAVFGTQTSPVVGSTYRQALATASYADGPAQLHAVVTDVAGNETTSADITVTIDNLAPAVSLDDPGAAVSGAVALSATAAADTAQVVFQRSPAGAGTWTTIATDSTPGDGFTASLNSNPLADGPYDVRAVATDGGGNSTTSDLRTTLVDNTLPTGSVTAPGIGAIVGGSAVQLAATAADAGGSGVASVAFAVKLVGSGSFGIVATDTSAPYAATWDASGAPDGATEIRVVVTDAAGNARQSAVIPVTVDSTGPSVTLVDPGSVLSGAVALSATTGGGAAKVQFSVSPANAGTWTQVGEDTSAPFGAPLDTAGFGDGLYDIRAVGFDSLDNPSAASVLEDVRFDNTAPALVGAAPGDGSVSPAASQVVLTASEPVTAPGALLDGAAAPAPTIVGNTLTFATGALADGLHVLSGELEDASGARVPFRVAITIESSPGADRPPVEKSALPGTATTLTAPGSLATLTMPASAWPSLPSPTDFLVLRVDLAPAAPVLGTTLLAGTQLVEVTAHWALAGTAVTAFEEPLDILIPESSGHPAVPATSADGTSWRYLPALAGPALPAGQQDGWYRDGAGVHVLTRHLSWFALLLDNQAPTAPRDLAGVVAADGLTLRWLPGTDASGQLGNLTLYVNGEAYREFGPTEFEAKLGAFDAGDSRRFTLIQRDAAGNSSPPSAALRVVPMLAGKSLEQAAAALAASGFALGSVSEEAVAGVVPGTVVQPTEPRLALEATAIDLVVARGALPAPQTKLVFSVAAAKKLVVQKRTTFAARIKASKPADVTATIFTAKKNGLHTWRLKVKAGVHIVKLRLPAQVRRPGTYTLLWVARSASETVSRSVEIVLVGPKLVQKRPKPTVEIVLAGATRPKHAIAPGLKGTGTRVVAVAGPDATFDLVASAAREIGIVVVDVDRYGVRFVSNLRTVFPELRLIAIAREPATRARAVRAGAVRALPRSTTAKRLAKAIAAVAGR